MLDNDNSFLTSSIHNHTKQQQEDEYLFNKTNNNNTNNIVSFLFLIKIMKGLFLFATILILFIFHLDAFVTSPKYELEQRRRRQEQQNRLIIQQQRDDYIEKTTSKLFAQSKDNDSDNDSNGNNNNDNSNNNNNDNITTTNSGLEMGDILWKLCPPPDISRWKKLWLRFAANMIRLDCKLKGVTPPLVLCPKGGQAVLEAYYYCDKDNNNNNKDNNNNNNKGEKKRINKHYKKVARFGFTTQRGPSNYEPMQETVQELYGIDSTKFSFGVGAIIYMYVEPEYRKQNIGKLALQVISLIQAIQGCDFTILVVDDNGSGKLIEWYQQHGGYSLAPKLQTIMGSPNAIHGVTMIAPTRRELPENLFIQWW